MCDGLLDELQTGLLLVILYYLKRTPTEITSLTGTERKNAKQPNQEEMKTCYRNHVVDVLSIVKEGIVENIITRAILPCLLLYILV